jgi:hypothetical protein
MNSALAGASMDRNIRIEFSLDGLPQAGEGYRTD